MPSEALKVEETLEMKLHRKIDREIRGVKDQNKLTTADEAKSIKLIKIEGPKLKEYEVVEPPTFWGDEKELKLGI